MKIVYIFGETAEWWETGIPVKKNLFKIVKLVEPDICNPVR